MKVRRLVEGNNPLCASETYHLMPVLLCFFSFFRKTGDYIVLCKRGARGFSAQRGRLCAVHPQEEGKPPWEPSWPGKGRDGGGPGAHHQEGGDKTHSGYVHNTKLLFQNKHSFSTLWFSVSEEVCSQADKQYILYIHYIILYGTINYVFRAVACLCTQKVDSLMELDAELPCPPQPLPCGAFL